MKFKNILNSDTLKNILIALSGFILSVSLYYLGHNYLCSLMLIITCITLIFYNKRINKNFINTLNVFAFFYFFSVAISCLQIHPAQTNWNFVTWLCIIFSFIFFVFGYSIKNAKKMLKENKCKHMTQKQLRIILILLFFCIIIAFATEVYIRNYIPYFSNDMSAYKNFSVTGIHYFTVSSVFMLPLTFLYIKKYKNSICLKEYVILIIENIICILIPILIVSRQLMFASIFISGFVVINQNHKCEILKFTLMIILCAISWYIIGNSRNQSDKYIEQTLIKNQNTVNTKNNDKYKTDYKQSEDNNVEKSNSNNNIQNNVKSTKDNTQKSNISTKELYKKIPVKIMNVYTYISLNYDNFDYNINRIDKLYYGQKSFFPIFALTGLKFLYPSITKTQYTNILPTYTTFPFFATPYEDFKLIGVCIYALIIGLFVKFLDNLSDDNEINVILKSLSKYALVFCFFTNFFSNPTFVFYLLLLILAKYFINYFLKGEK